MNFVTIRRLCAGDEALARSTFALMASVFEEEPSPISDAWLAALLSRPDFWAYVALRDNVPAGGITAHALPMTRNESVELFIYDLAVEDASQRMGIGRMLVNTLQVDAAAQGIGVSFVPADQEDTGALDFYRAIGGTEASVSMFDWRTTIPKATNRPPDQ